MKKTITIKQQFLSGNLIDNDSDSIYYDDLATASSYAKKLEKEYKNVFSEDYSDYNLEVSVDFQRASGCGGWFIVEVEHDGEVNQECLDIVNEIEERYKHISGFVFENYNWIVWEQQEEIDNWEENLIEIDILCDNLNINEIEYNKRLNEFKNDWVDDSTENLVLIDGENYTEIFIKDYSYLFYDNFIDIIRKCNL